MYGKALIKSGITFILGSLLMMSINTVYAEIDSYNNDVLLSNMVVDSIKTNYKEFNAKANEFKENLDSTYDSFDFYLDDYGTKGEVASNNMSNLRNDVVELKESSMALYKYCLYGINNSETKSMCKAFEENYKGIVNSYKVVLSDYNDILEQYNVYASAKSMDIVDKLNVELPVTIDKIYDKIK